MSGVKKSGAKKVGSEFEGAKLGRFQEGQYALEPSPKLPLDLALVDVRYVKRACDDLRVDVPPDAPPAKLLDALCRKLENFLLDFEEQDGRLRAAKKDAEATIFNDNSMFCGRCRGMGTRHTSEYCPFCGSVDGVNPPGDELGAPLPVAAEQPGGESSDSEQHEVGVAGALEVLPPEAVVEDGPFKAALARLAMLRANAELNFYDIGVELRRIQEEELWKSGGYSSFQDFVDQESRLSRSVAYRLIQVAKDFSREDFAAVGSSKLKILATIEDASTRQRLLEEAKNGASTRQLQSMKDEAAGGKREVPPREDKPGAPPAEPTVALLGRVGGNPKTLKFRTAEVEAVEHHCEGAYVAIPVVEGVECHVALKVRGKLTDEVKKALAQVVGLSYCFVDADGG